MSIERRIKIMEVQTKGAENVTIKITKTIIGPDMQIIREETKIVTLQGVPSRRGGMR